MIEITRSLEFTQNKLDKELKVVKFDITKIKSEKKEFTNAQTQILFLTSLLNQKTDLEGTIFTMLLLNNQTEFGKKAKKKSWK